MSRMASRLSGAAPVFAALGDETRLRLISRLCVEGPLSITALTSDVEISRQGVTKHLRALSDAGLVKDRRQGRERIWELEPKRIEVARKCLDQISAQWDAAIGRLRSFVED